MTVQQIKDLNIPIGEIMRTAGTNGVLLEPEGQPRYAVLPLDDDLVDYLIERSPRFMDVCREIRHRMEAGRFHTHEQVKELLAKQ